MLNTTVCNRGVRAAIGKARHMTDTQASSIHATALPQCPPTWRTGLHRSMILLRPGTLPRGAYTDFEATGMCESEELLYSTSWCQIA